MYILAFIFQVEIYTFLIADVWCDQLIPRIMDLSITCTSLTWNTSLKYVRWYCTVIPCIIVISSSVKITLYLRCKNTLITLSELFRIVRRTAVPYIVSRRSAYNTGERLSMSRLDMRTTAPDTASRNFSDWAIGNEDTTVTESVLTVVVQKTKKGVRGNV